MPNRVFTSERRDLALLDAAAENPGRRRPDRRAREVMATLSPVEPGPLPPHERPWRHPSELGPPPHEPTSTTGRVLIASTATLGLLLVGVLALTMTPRRSGAPIAANSTLSSLRAVTTSSAPTQLLPLVTPLGDEGWGVTTADALSGARGSSVQVRLPAGEVIEVEVVGPDTSGDLTIVSLPPETVTETFELATDQPAPTDTVLVHTEEPVVVSVNEIVHLEVDEATPVVDERGRLVGLCTGEPDEHWLAPVDTMPVDPSATTTSTTTSTTTTTTTPITTSTSSAPTTVTTPAPPTAIVPTVPGGDPPPAPSVPTYTTPTTVDSESETEPTREGRSGRRGGSTTTTVKPGRDASGGRD